MVASVEGVDAVVRAMNDMGDKFARTDTDKIVRQGAWMACATAKSLCPEGKKSRDLVERKKAPVNKDISERTDTVRYATHFVVFRRQGKKPFFVPVTVNPFAKIEDDGISPKKGTEDYAKFASNTKRRNKFKPMTVFKYQQTRNSTKPNEKGQRWVYDKPAEIASLRKIKRRGLAGDAWSHIAKQTGTSGSNTKAIGVSVPKKIKSVNYKFAKKYSDYKHKKNVGNSEVILHNKLTYLTDKYGDIEQAIYAKTAYNLNVMTEKILKKRAEQAQKKMDRVA